MVYWSTTLVSGLNLTEAISLACVHHCMRTENKTTDQILTIDFFPYAVEKTLKQLTPTTSTGPDGISNMLLKHCATSLAVPLSQIFDTSFNCNSTDLLTTLLHHLMFQRFQVKTTVYFLINGLYECHVQPCYGHVVVQTGSAREDCLGWS